MTSRTAFLFPGLGAYSPGMLRQARVDFPVVDDLFDEIDGVCAEQGYQTVRAPLFEGEALTQEELLDKHPAELLQLAIFGASVAVHRILLSIGARPFVLVGHSFGEIAALVASGAFDLADGTRLVLARAEALRPWEDVGAMAAVGASQTVTAHLIGALDEPDLVIACLNAPGQTVISGPLEAVERAGTAAEGLGLFFTRLYLPYSSHHPSMRPAVDRFVELTSEVRQRPMALQVISPIHRRRLTDEDDLRRALAEDLTLPVHFTETVQELHARGVRDFVEVGALRALTRNASLTVPDIRVFTPLTDPDNETGELRRAAARRPAEAGTAPVATRTAPPVATRTAPPLATRTAPPVPARPPASPTAPSGPTRGDVLDRLRALYAEALEYPPEVLADDAELEAALGVDSLKQTALLRRVADRFGIGDAADMRLLELSTLGRIADHVLTHQAAGGAMR